MQISFGGLSCVPPQSVNSNIDLPPSIAIPLAKNRPNTKQHTLPAFQSTLPSISTLLDCSLSPIHQPVSTDLPSSSIQQSSTTFVSHMAGAQRTSNNYTPLVDIPGLQTISSTPHGTFHFSQFSLSSPFKPLTVNPQTSLRLPTEISAEKLTNY